MLTIFIVDKDVENIYIVTPDKFSEVLQKLGIEPERVTFKNVSLESLMLLNDNALEYLKL